VVPHRDPVDRAVEARAARDEELDRLVVAAADRAVDRTLATAVRAVDRVAEREQPLEVPRVVAVRGSVVQRRVADVVGVRLDPPLGEERVEDLVVRLERELVQRRAVLLSGGLVGRIRTELEDELHARDALRRVLAVLGAGVHQRRLAAIGRIDGPPRAHRLRHPPAVRPLDAPPPPGPAAFAFFGAAFAFFGAGFAFFGAAVFAAFLAGAFLAGAFTTFFLVTFFFAATCRCYQLDVARSRPREVCA